MFTTLLEDHELDCVLREKAFQRLRCVCDTSASLFFTLSRGYTVEGVTQTILTFFNPCTLTRDVRGEEKYFPPKLEICAISLTLWLTTVNAARILGIFPIAAKSHFTTNLAVMESLHAAGHQITIVSPFPIERKVPNFTYVNSHVGDSIFIGQSTFEEFYRINIHGLFRIFASEDIKYCYNVMKLPEIQRVLNSKEKLYDVLFVELLFAFECYLPMGQKLGIPIIGTVTLRSFKFADSALGLPNNPAVIPFELSPFSKVEMNFVERIENLWSHIEIDYYLKIKIREEIRKFYSQHYTEDLLDKNDFSMMFLNNHPCLLPLSMPPNVVEIGGISVKPPKPLPKDLQKFIDEATHGVILFTFGSVIKMSTIPSKKRNAFVTAFASIPQRVIWKFEEPIENLPKNVMLSNWLPQRDILEHRNVVAFISHCGQGSVYEALATATPVVTVPIFADQQSNADILHSHGVAVKLDLMSVTKEDVVAALNKIINDTIYYQRMQELSRKFKDRPMSPEELVVYWTEYVVRNNGAPYLKALGSTMPLYKYLMLDILALVIIIMSFALFVVYAVVRKIRDALITCTKSTEKCKAVKKDQ